MLCRDDQWYLVAVTLFLFIVHTTSNNTKANNDLLIKKEAHISSVWFQYSGVCQDLNITVVQSSLLWSILLVNVITANFLAPWDRSILSVEQSSNPSTCSVNKNIITRLLLNVHGSLVCTRKKSIIAIIWIQTRLPKVILWKTIFILRFIVRAEHLFDVVMPWRQAISWTNYGRVHRSIYASMI